MKISIGNDEEEKGGEGERESEKGYGGETEETGR